MRTMNRDMERTTQLPIIIPSDRELAEAMLRRMEDRQRVRRVAAQMAPQIERALGIRRRGTS